MKPGGQLIYTTFERLPVDEAYDKMDKTKWCKYQHSRFMSSFCRSENPFEEFKKLTLEIGFQEDKFALIDNLSLYTPNESIMRGKQFFISNFYVLYMMFSIICLK